MSGEIPQGDCLEEITLYDLKVVVDILLTTLCIESFDYKEEKATCLMPPMKGTGK